MVECFFLPLNVLDAVNEEVQPYFSLEAGASQQGLADELLIRCQQWSLGGVFLVCEMAIERHAVCVW